MMLTEENRNILDNFKKRYSHLHPLILHRSFERSNNFLELFEILESIPKFPISWDDDKKVWSTNTDITSQKKLKKIRK